MTAPIYTKTILDNLSTVEQWIADGATFFVGHSGGKDSQALYAVIKSWVPADQIVVVHADLGDVEWDGIQDHIKANIQHPLNVVEATPYKDGTPKTLLERIDRNHRRLVAAGRNVNPWPDNNNRFCTGELKTDPIWKYIRHHPAKIAINCVGIRAEESTRRSKANPLKINKKNTCSDRVQRAAFDFYPIFDLFEIDVWNIIAADGQKRHHAYDDGNDRLSCKFCVFGSPGDWQNAARHDPALYAWYVEAEKRYGFTIKQDKPIEEWVGIRVEDLDPTPPGLTTDAEVAQLDNDTSTGETDGEEEAQEPVQPAPAEQGAEDDHRQQEGEEDEGLRRRSTPALTKIALLAVAYAPSHGGKKLRHFIDFYPDLSEAEAVAVRAQRNRIDRLRAKRYRRRCNNGDPLLLARSSRPFRTPTAIAAAAAETQARRDRIERDLERSRRAEQHAVDTRKTLLAAARTARSLGFKVRSSSNHSGRVSSYYCTRDGQGFRISDHEIPWTAQRQSNAQFHGGRDFNGYHGDQLIIDGHHTATWLRRAITLTAAGRAVPGAA